MYSTVNRPYQGILSSQNVTQFYGKHINVILFAPTRKAFHFILFASVLPHLVTMDLSKFIQVEYNLIFNKHTLGTTINI